jgi:hypothetical protein
MFGGMQLKIRTYFFFYLTAMILLLLQLLNKRNLMNLCIGTLTDPSVMIMTGQSPTLVVSSVTLVK